MNNHADSNDCCNSISIGLQLSKYLKKKQSKKWSCYFTDSKKEYVSSAGVGGQIDLRKKGVLNLLKMTERLRKTN